VRQACLAVLALALSTALALDDDDEDELAEQRARLADLPAPARDTIARLAGSHRILEVERHTEAGTTIYEAEYEVDGLEHCIEVGADGELLALEKELPPARLPAAVRTSVLALHPRGRIREAAAVFPGGASETGWYEVEVEVAGRQRELRVRPSGEIVR
jgi:hypothetical protein